MFLQLLSIVMERSEYETKIKRLERQATRYEEDIQYLYNIIEKLELQKSHSEKELQSLKDQLAESHRRLKNSDRLCDEKEKFILFRESQLLESEDTIYKLKQRILTLSSKMSESRPRSRSRSLSRGDIISLETLSNTRLLEEIADSAEELYQQAIGAERLPNVGVAQHLKNRITRASELINTDASTQATIREELLHEIEDYKGTIHRLDESLQGAIVEITGKSILITELNAALRETHDECEEVKTNLNNLLTESDRLEENYEILAGGLQRNLDLTRRDLNRAEQDIDNLKRTSRNMITRLDQDNIGLKRRIGIMRLQNQWRQIRLMNPPNIVPLQPQVTDQIWLLFH
jgi:chromosome segregation ATPase